MTTFTKSLCPTKSKVSITYLFVTENACQLLFSKTDETLRENEVDIKLPNNLCLQFRLQRHYSRLSDVSNRNILSQFWRLGSPRCQQTQGLVRTPFLFADGHLLVMSSPSREQRQSKLSSYTGTRSIERAPFSWPQLNLITSQRSSLQIPSYWDHILSSHHGVTQR
jgi:hypothetical protein